MISTVSVTVKCITTQTIIHSVTHTRCKFPRDVRLQDAVLEDRRVCH